MLAQVGMPCSFSNVKPKKTYKKFLIIKDLYINLANRVPPYGGISLVRNSV